MITINSTLSSSPNKPYDLSETSSKIPLSVVLEKGGTSLNEVALFTAHFNAIPNFIEETRIDCKKASNWLAENYKSKIKDFYYSRRLILEMRETDFDDIFYFIYDDLIVNFDTNCSIARFLYRKTAFSKVEEIINGIAKFKKKKKTSSYQPRISLLVNNNSGIGTTSLKITKPKLKIEDNYNEDFKKVHQIILKNLSRKNEKGLVLLHGKPGTGKTSYIRYLIASLKKKIIFLPPNMAGAITNPGLISILIDNPNSVFVIEDAENIVIDREQKGNSPVSALLNISDGLLADCLNVQIICSFNTDISKIDSALMRKGRLIAKYEFKELETEKAQLLSNKLGFNSIINHPMTLTSIYNQEEMDFEGNRERKVIGFSAVGVSGN